MAEHVGHDAERGRDREQVHDHGLQRHEHRPEGQEQEQERQRQHHGDGQGELVADLIREIDVAGRLAAHVGGHVLALGGLGDRVVAQVIDDVLGLGRRGRVVRDDRVDGGVAAVVDQRLRDRLDAGRLLHVGAHVLEARVGSRRLEEVLLLLGLVRLALVLLVLLLLLLVDVVGGLLLGLLLGHALGHELLGLVLDVLLGLVLLLLLLVLLLLLDVVELLLVVLGRLAQGDGDEHGPVLPAAEAAADRVVGHPRLRVLGQRAVVGLAEVEVADRDRQHDEDDQRHAHRRPRVPGHEHGPAAPAVGLGVVLVLEPGDLQRVDLRAEQRQHGRQQRRRRQHRDEHDDARGVAQRRHQRDAGHEQRHERDDHRAPREDHGAARGRVGAGYRLADLHLVVLQLVSVPGDDEQAVVDAHAQADHGRQGRRRRRHLHDLAEDADDAQAGDERDDRREDRHPHGHEGPEGEEEDDDRGREPDDLGQVGRGLGQLLPDVGADRDLHAVRLARVGDVEDVLRGLLVHLARALLQRERDVADGLVLRQLGRAVGVEGADRAVDRVLVVLVVVVDLLDRVLVGGLVELVAVWRDEDDRDGAVGLLGELLVEQVGGLLTVGAREGEVVAGVLPERHRDSRKRDEGDEPDGDDDELVADTEVAEVVKRSSHGLT